MPRLKIACGDKYLGLLEDGETLGLVEEEQAEIFESVLWDNPYDTNIVYKFLNEKLNLYFDN